jgi:hypothetical protein
MSADGVMGYSSLWESPFCSQALCPCYFHVTLHGISDLGAHMPHLELFYSLSSLLLLLIA